MNGESRRDSPSHPTHDSDCRFSIRTDLVYTRSVLVVCEAEWDRLPEIAACAYSPKRDPGSCPCIDNERMDLSSLNSSYVVCGCGHTSGTAKGRALVVGPICLASRVTDSAPRSAIGRGLVLHIIHSVALSYMIHSFIHLHELSYICTSSQSKDPMLHAPYVQY